VTLTLGVYPLFKVLASKAPLSAHLYARYVSTLSKSIDRLFRNLEESRNVCESENFVGHRQVPVLFSPYSVLAVPISRAPYKTQEIFCASATRKTCFLLLAWKMCGWYKDLLFSTGSVYSCFVGVVYQGYVIAL
jgi:hypothetical protein